MKLTNINPKLNTNCILGNVYGTEGCLFKDDLLCLSVNCIFGNLNGHHEMLIKEDLL